jgi:hypothetical protein
VRLERLHLLRVTQLHRRTDDAHQFQHFARVGEGHFPLSDYLFPKSLGGELVHLAGFLESRCTAAR